MKAILRYAVVVMVCVLALVISQAASGETRVNPNPTRLIPVERSPFGTSYGDWAATWWQWALAIPAGPGHPLFDETGVDCGVGQSGPVFFLGGVFNVSGSAVRDCTVPARKHLFLPIVNVECSNVEGNGNDGAALRACADFFASLARDLVLELDGASFTNLTSFRTLSPAFGFALPDGNLFQLFGVDAPAGTCSKDGMGICVDYLSAGDGFYVMLAPLSAGQHTLHFRGTFGDPINFTTDVTYHLTIQ